MGEASLQTPGSVGNEGEEVLQVLEQIPVKLVVKTVVGPAGLLQPTVVHIGAEILQTLEDPTLAQMDAQRQL